MSQGIGRRDFLGLMGAGIAAAAASGCAGREDAARKAVEAARSRRWNVLWISCEDISPDLGCYGHPTVRTPNIDRLAAEGARYSLAFTVAPVCAPNRSGIITAMYPNSIGSMHMRTSTRGYECVPPPNVRCFTEYLRAAGYFCTNRAKTDYQFAPPVTAWDRNGSGHGDWAERDPGQPFFSVINHEVTHESRIRIPPELEPRIDPASVPVPPYYPDTPIVRRDIARYLDNIETLDAQVGEALERLERDGLAGSTVVFFWGDHGWGMPRGKRWLYDSGIRFPLIVRWPGVIEPGTVSDELVNSIDLGPSALSVADLEIPAQIQGQAFLGPRKAPPRRYVFSHRDRMDETHDMLRSVRGPRYHYIRNYRPDLPYAQRIEYMDMMPTMREWRRLHAENALTGPQRLFFSRTKPVHELYDTLADPHEVNNLAGDPRYDSVMEEMSGALERWMEEIGDLGDIQEDQLIERMWPGGVQLVTLAPTAGPPPGQYAGKVVVRLACPTHGASIAWTADEGGHPRWKLFSGEVVLDSSAVLRAKAIRIGYKESPEIAGRYEIV